MVTVVGQCKPAGLDKRFQTIRVVSMHARTTPDQNGECSSLADSVMVTSSRKRVNAGPAVLSLTSSAYRPGASLHQL
eukprot:6485742-Amphidinium_carterae.3